jgi:hypothetical protein
LPSAAYTAQVGGGAGVALVELYDAATSAFPTSPRLTNISARTRAGSGSESLIVGFVIGGDSAKTILVRGIGPALTAFGVTGALPTPRLQLFRDAMPVTENSGWADDPALASAFTKVGAFALAPGSKDAAMLVTLLPGAYTIQASGANNTTGVALVEVYELP